jgi:Pyruvate/2-oxoacid:ferredoxin oxidoreductase gamma subunit
MQFCLRNSVNTARPRLAVLIFVGAFVGLSVAPPALAQFEKLAQFGKKGKQDPAAEEKLPPGMTMSKTQAIAALINALAVNQSDAARETLEQIVVGKTSFGAHSKQAAETALVALAMRQSPDASAFLLRLLAEPDDKIRPADSDYPAAAVRYDAARVGCRVGSAELRVGLAKWHDRATPEVRSVIETTLNTPSAANLSAQIVLLRSRSLPDAIRTNLQKLVLDQNAAALKQALKIAGETPAQDAPPTVGLGALPGLGNPATGRPPAAPALAAAQNPVAVALDISEKALNAKPADPAAVARELWQNEFVEAVAALLATQKTNPKQMLAAIGSIPLKTARERLRDYLLMKSPREVGALEQPAAVAGAPAGRGINGGMGMGGMPAGGGAGRGQGSKGGSGRPAGMTAHSQIYAVGADWLDPGTVVVLKTLPYKDRPKTKHRAPSPGGGSKRSPLAEKRAEEAAEKQKQTEAQYEWRDTIENFVSHWDERLSEVAVASEGAAKNKDATADAKEEKTPAADKSKGGSTKSGKGSDSASKKSARTSEKKDASESKSKGGPAAPTPAVTLPFSLRPGEKITKEFHLRWPEDLPPNLAGAFSEPLVIHYVQLEGTDDVNRTATFYKSALSKGTGTKSATHDIESGKWVDILQRDLNGQRTRSIDVLVARQPPEPDAKKSKIEELTIQVLMVEVESFGPEPKETEKKEQAKSDSP